MSKFCPYINGNTVYLTCKECEEHICDSSYFYCLVVGSRNFNDYELLKERLDKALYKYTDVVIVSGGATGADTLAEKYAKEKGYYLKVFKPDWNKYGKAAGPIRNEEMHKYISHFSHRGCIAFWDGQSKGTLSNFDLANKYNNQMIKVLYN